LFYIGDAPGYSFTFSAAVNMKPEEKNQKKQEKDSKKPLPHDVIITMRQNFVHKKFRRYGKIFL